MQQEGEKQSELELNPRHQGALLGEYVIEDVWFTAMVKSIFQKDNDGHSDQADSVKTWNKSRWVSSC